MRFATADPRLHPEQPYQIEDGIVLDSTEDKAVYADFWTRYWNVPKEVREAEDAEWASRSGPVRIIRPARAT